ncbi:MAG: SDR family NAD(P)-dependent oxidoreductase [Candidatus Microthrix sp.]|nr:SDR family NAD(P)-dependent oxidoreductase [Candidatus Microthrix sp.]
MNIPGVIAEQNLPGMAAYGASKAAARSFDEALAREARRRKIRVIDALTATHRDRLGESSLEGQTPKMPKGLDPVAVAQRSATPRRRHHRPSQYSVSPDRRHS